MNKIIRKIAIERKEKLMNSLRENVYPTSQIFHGQITVDEYINGITDFFAREVLDRRMKLATLPMFAELAVIRHALGEWKY